MKLNSLLAISLMSISVAFPALANTRSEVIATLQQKTSVPVEFPGSLPNTGGEEVYLNWSADNNSYNVNFDYTNDCNGATACNMGSFSAEKGGIVVPKSEFSFSDRSDIPIEMQDKYEYIKLDNGYNAVFMYGCGAYCNATLQWKINNVLYSIYLKNGNKEEVMKIANSVYN